MVVILACISAMLLFTFWFVYPYEIFVSNVNPMKVVTKKVRIGENFTYIADYCKFTDLIPTRIVRQLVDGYAYDLPVSQSNNFPKGCRKVEVTIPLTLPNTVKAGTYHIKVTGEYQVNPVRSWTYVLETEDFELIK